MVKYIPPPILPVNSPNRIPLLNNARGHYTISELWGHYTIRDSSGGQYTIGDLGLDIYLDRPEFANINRNSYVRLPLYCYLGGGMAYSN